ncbi:MAG: alpha/beta hydrolase family protein, partial [Bryobacteraceae bacterium]
WQCRSQIMASLRRYNHAIRTVPKSTVVLLSICLFILSASAQEKPSDPLLRWMDQIAQQHLAKRETTIAAIRTVADAERRKESVRAKLLDLIGGLPNQRGPLNARVTGRITNASYTLEKVIFESLPKFFVTANLYRPNEPGRYPAVLMSAGHTTLGKTENHRMSANLAAKGFVVLAYDPAGLGERFQAFDKRVGRTIAGCCANEHLQAGAQSFLIGQSVARYFIWDAMRALDYLLSRPDVDAARVGAAGCSGGGCLTTYIAALDPRVKAAAPACFINSLRLLFAGPYPDSEMSLPGFIEAGLDHADFLELVAPKPWLILATEGDYFTPPGARLVYEETRRWYRLYDAEDNVRFFVAPGPHGTPVEARETMYAWMIRWLKDGKGDAREQTVPLYPDHELQVTASGHVEDEPGSRKLYQLILEEFRARRQPRGVPELVAELRRLKIPAEARAPVVTTVDKTTARITLDTESGLQIAGVLHVPQTTGRKPALLLLRDRSSATLASAAAASGNVVLELEPRDSQGAYDNRPFLGNWLTNTRANSIGRNLAAMRAHDVLRGVDLLASRYDVDAARIRAAARDVKGIWLLLATAVDTRIGKIWLDRTAHSLSAAMEGPLNTNLFDAMIPGFLLHWDLDDLVRAMGKRSVLWTDPTNWMGQIQGLGARFQYRFSGETDDRFLAELVR